MGTVLVIKGLAVMFAGYLLYKFVTFIGEGIVFNKSKKK